MDTIKAFYSHSSALSQKEYLNILRSFYKYNSDILLSLYDIKYYLKDEMDLIQDIFSSSRSIFLDSGVYEVDACRRLGLSIKEWNYSSYLGTLKYVLSKLDIGCELYITNYDSYGIPLKEQINSSINTFGIVSKEFALKNTKYVFTLHSDPTIISEWEKSNIQNIGSNFNNMAIIAMPEKELGNNIVDKIKNIKFLVSQGYPLHLLGCLDPTYLIIFALAGVRYFDGLNWIKFYFNNKLSYYKNIYELDVIKGKAVDSRSRIVNNCIYIGKLINDLEFSLATEDYSMFNDELNLLSRLI